MACAIAFVVGGIGAESSRSALFFLFSPSSAHPGDRVVVRMGGTPADFTLRDRLRPFGQPIRVYLIANAIADDVRSQHDPRLVLVGNLVPDKNSHGLLSFSVPNVKSGSYAAAWWCPACAAYSAGRAFSARSIGDDDVPRYRMLELLRVKTDGSRYVWPLAIGLATALAAVGAVFFWRRATR
jgi:hypothetical protein